VSGAASGSLDDIPGLGEVRVKKLVKAMGGVTAVKRASLEELRQHSFLPDAVAEAIYAKFHGDISPNGDDGAGA